MSKPLYRRGPDAVDTYVWRDGAGDAATRARVGGRGADSGNGGRVYGGMGLLGSVLHLRGEVMASVCLSLPPSLPPSLLSPSLVSLSPPPPFLCLFLPKIRRFSLPSPKTQTPKSYMHMHMHLRMHTCTCTCTCTCICTCTCTCAHTRAHTHAQTHTCTHMHTHT